MRTVDPVEPLSTGRVVWHTAASAQGLYGETDQIRDRKSKDDPSLITSFAYAKQRVGEKQIIS